MEIKTFDFNLKTKGFNDIIDITGEVQKIINDRKKALVKEKQQLLKDQGIEVEKEIRTKKQRRNNTLRVFD